MEADKELSETSDGNNESASVISPQITCLLVLLFGFPLFWLLWLGSYVLVPGPEPALHAAGNRVEVVIPRQTSLKKISKILAEKGVIRDDTRFVMLAYLMQVANRLQAGEYELEPGKKPYEVLNVLASGRVLFRPITIPEGADIRKVAAILAADGWVDRDRFLALVVDPALIKELELDVDSLEGYLFPETYSLSRGHQAEQDLIKMMVEKSKEIYEDIIGKAGKNIDLNRHQILTLASIVEKETASADERSLIAGVLLNRYRKGMRLQADPTVIYGLSNFTGNLTRQNLKTPSPYNTYLIDGLPPGPISNPGRAAIEAVVMPNDGHYLYFVSKNDGSHHFSKTLAEHNQAVRKYQKGRN